MSDSPRLGDVILRFGDEEPDEGEVRAERFIERRAARDIKIDKEPLSEIFGSRFRIPDYQREYEWEEDEWDNLWEELQRLVEVNPQSTNWVMNDVFFGSMFFSERDAAEVLGPEEEGEVFDIIDGQQRITTLSIIFKILADTLTQSLSRCDPAFIGRYSHHVGDTNNLVYQSSDPESDVSLILDNNQNDFYKHLMKDESERLNYILSCDVVNNNMIYGAISVRKYLKYLNIDTETYLQALLNDERFEENGGNRPNLDQTRSRSIDGVDSIDELSNRQRSNLLKNKVEFDRVSERLAEAYDYFFEKLHTELSDYESPEQQYRAAANIKDYILKDYYVGYFRVGDNRPQLLMRIFEVLNDRGVDLKKTDIIRTRLVSRLRSDGDESDYKEYTRKWRQIINTFGKSHEVIIEFLTTYFVAVDTTGPNNSWSQITSRGEVSNHLLEAFTLRQSSGENRTLRSHLTDIDDTKRLIDSIKEYAPYYHDIRNPNDKGIRLGDSVDDVYESRCNRILTRLNDSNTDIWEPVILSFYHDIDNNELGTVNDLLNVLETVESLVIRYYVSGDINIKDSIYANGIREYHNDGTPDEILEEMVETARTDDGVTGTDLVDALCSTEWSSKMSRQALRMIDSAALEAEEGTLITQKLNRDNNIVHNEHIFPSSPLLSGDGKYDWLRAYFNLNHGQPDNANFFDLDSEDYDLLEEGLSQFGNVITHLIEEEEDEQLEEIATQFSTILGNQILLWYETNLEISNQQYSTKLPAYDSTTHFDLLSSSQYLRTQHMQSEDYAKAETYYALRVLKDKLQDEGRYEDIVEEFIGSNEEHNFTNFERICETVEEIRDEATSEEDFQENLHESLHSDALLEAKQRINQLWTFETTTRNLVIILRKLCSVLQFDAVDILNDEFGETEFEYRAQREINRKRGIIGYNYAE